MDVIRELLLPRVPPGASPLAYRATYYAIGGFALVGVACTCWFAVVGGAELLARVTG